jgi:hypothetical protein
MTKINKSPIGNTKAHLNNDELREKVRDIFGQIFGEKLPPLAKLASVKIMAHLDEIMHLLVDYRKGLNSFQIGDEDVLERFSNEQILAMSRNKLQMVTKIIDSERKQQVDYFKILETFCKANQAQIEAMDESQQDRIAEVAEFSLQQQDLRRSTLLTNENMGKVINNYRVSEGLTDREWAKQAGTTPAKLAQAEAGELSEAKVLKEKLDQMLRPMTLHSEILYRVYTVKEDGKV